MSLKRYLCVSLSLLLLIVTGFVATPQSNAAPIYYSINAQTVQQLGDYLCWAACLTSAVSYIKNINVQQAAFPRFLFNGQFLDKTVSMDEVKLCLDHWGVRWTYNSLPISYSSIKSTTLNSRPGFAGLFFFLGGAHLVEIIGYFESDSEQYVIYMEPADGTTKLMEYSRFKNNTTNGWNWYETLFNLRST